MAKFKDFSRPLCVFQVLFKAHFIFKGFSRQPCIIKYFSSWCENPEMVEWFCHSAWVLFSRNFAMAKFCQNKTLVKICSTYRFADSLWLFRVTQGSQLLVTEQSKKGYHWWWGLCCNWGLKKNSRNFNWGWAWHKTSDEMYAMLNIFICLYLSVWPCCYLQKWKPWLDSFEQDTLSSFKKLIKFLECSWNHKYMPWWDLLQSKWSLKGFTLTLQETRSIHDSMNIPKIEFIAYIYILL